METTTIILSPSNDEVESFDLNDRNILKVRVQTPDGEMISGPGCKVEITLSRDAMLGLGIELVRAAHKDGAETRVWHFRPADESLASRVLGAYLHPASCELIVAGTTFPTLEELLKA